MRRTRFGSCSLRLAAVLLRWPFPWQSAVGPWRPPPLSLDGYRDEKLPTGRDDSAGLKEINGGCYVCHGNYRTESLVAQPRQGEGRLYRVPRRIAPAPGGRIPPHAAREDVRPAQRRQDVRQVSRGPRRAGQEGHRSDGSNAARRRPIPRKSSAPTATSSIAFRSRTVVWDKKTGKLVVHKKDQDANNGKNKSPRRRSETSRLIGGGRHFIFLIIFGGCFCSIAMRNPGGHRYPSVKSNTPV